MIIRMLGRCDAASTIEAMRRFTEARIDAGSTVDDELWVCEHDPVYTQGLAGKAEHVLAARDIPVLPTNRGGQVTYHGPGQVVAYPLVDLRHLGIYVKEYVYRLEAAVLATLAHCGITGHRVTGAPGIYVRLDDPRSHASLAPPQPGVDPFKGLGKVAALGIKVSRHCSYHGVALNIDMDLEPYSRINPCGYEGLRTVDLAGLGVRLSWAEAAELLAGELQRKLQP